VRKRNRPRPAWEERCSRKFNECFRVASVTSRWISAVGVIIRRPRPSRQSFRSLVSPTDDTPECPGRRCVLTVGPRLFVELLYFRRALGVVLKVRRRANPSPTPRGKVAGAGAWGNFPDPCSSIFGHPVGVRRPPFSVVIQAHEPVSPRPTRDSASAPGARPIQSRRELSLTDDFCAQSDRAEKI